MGKIDDHIARNHLFYRKEKDSQVIEQVPKSLLTALHNKCDEYEQRIKKLEAQLANDVTGREWVQLLKRSKELEARLKQTQDWRDYYRARWIGESMEDVVRTPMTDAELEKALEQP